ncbi:MAG: cystathionine gamma-synthase [Bdellovibrionaceae bacterium]|nr:cystathionine gamma-synthase [Pseudobdellovibrionaceae bacterium]|tara:strand:- start:106600 stop:107754 length:1155 start_codon:yes stop_codon:yes gene_type:complete
MNIKEAGFETRAIHVGQEPEAEYGSVMKPIYLTTTFAQKSPGVMPKYDYSRGGNPSRTSYEQCVASLESAKHGFAFSSGCAATSTVIQMLESGDHVIANDDMYGGTNRLFSRVMSKFGIEFSFVDLNDSSQLESAVKENTKLIWLESPTNPTLKIADIRKITDFAKSKGIITAVDNTFMSPYFQRPLELGADIVMHSATKYLNGHSDVVGGVLCTNSDDLAEKINFLVMSVGAVQSPFDSYMATRSLKTLAVRMRAHQENAQSVAEFLEGHNRVEKVLYPGLESHPQHELAKSQMHGFGGMITFFIKGGLAEARNFLESVQVFTLAESLGGVESLIEHPAIMTHASVPADQREALGISDTLIRISVGIEDKKDLIADLEQALGG